MAQITLENVCKIYDGGVKAVNNVNLEIRDKEFMVLVGPSGCGKSTCLRMIAGLEEISSGTIKIGDRVVNDIVPKDRDIAMVFQNYALYPHMSVYDNMAFGLKLRKVPKSEIKRRVMEAAEILGLTDYLERRPKQMSGGQRQRVAVGRAIVRNPSAFLFDEPLSNLDAKMRVQMRTEISKLHQRLGGTMVYVTHDQTEAMTMGDRICVMKDGVIQQVATPLELYDRPCNKFVAGFIGTPPMNFVNGKIVKDTDDGLKFVTDGPGFEMIIPVSMKSTLANYENKEVILGVRPEDLTVRNLENMGNLGVVPAQVEVVEPMGSETIIYVLAGQHSLISRIDAHEKTAPGNYIKLSLIPEKCHFFNAATELRIN